ncbi:hypothetical protein Ahy_A01g001466 isoform D [Arachis hypogaea]|uniref:Uncharacterized protein n=1 Tax=Arachis hypogaea TaxID=3818 RepID=A0A445ENF1_ARAHY|nr:hypothetical protein Ahy_A01g001466 isoform D [Arachis hypogaea]
MASSCVVGTSFLIPLLHYSRQPSTTTNLTTTAIRGKGVIAAGVGNNNGGGEVERSTMVKKQHEKCSGLNFSGEKPETPVLDTVNYPIHMKNLSIEELEALADELREEIVYTVSKTGGHLSSSLGVADLTVALHYVFNTPQDKIVWDVGHQAYAHKILTGRRSKMHTIRQTGGLAGFPKIAESLHDAFGVGHSSTSISAALGMAVARDLIGKNNHVISVVGDGAMTAGQAYEAMNNAGFLDTNLIIILNDNEQVSLPTATLDGPTPPVGALSRALTKLHTNSNFHQLRQAAKVGKGRVLKEGSKVALVGYGTMVQSCVAAAKVLEAHGISTTVADARFCKPLDGQLMMQLAREHEILITVEEGSIGGGRAMTLPDRYIEHGSQKDQIQEVGLSSNHIAATALSLTNVQWDNRNHFRGQ